MFCRGLKTPLTHVQSENIVVHISPLQAFGEFDRSRGYGKLLDFASANCNLRKKYFEKNNEIQYNWTGPSNFDIYFCALF